MVEHGWFSAVNYGLFAQFQALDLILLKYKVLDAFAELTGTLSAVLDVLEHRPLSGKFFKAAIDSLAWLCLDEGLSFFASSL